MCLYNQYTIICHTKEKSFSKFYQESKLIHLIPYTCLVPRVFGAFSRVSPECKKYRSREKNRTLMI